MPCHTSPVISLRTLCSSHCPGTTFSRAMRSAARTSASRTPRTRASASRSPSRFTPDAMENVRLESSLTGAAGRTHAGGQREPHCRQHRAHREYSGSPVVRSNPAAKQSAEEHAQRLRGVIHADGDAAALRRREARNQRRQQRLQHVEGDEEAEQQRGERRRCRPPNAANAASAASRSSTAPISTGFERLRRSAYRIAGIISTNEPSTTGR